MLKVYYLLTFFLLRGYPCASLENDLRRVATINLPDALCRLSRKTEPLIECLWFSHTTCLTPKSTVLLQNFRILSTDQQTRDIFPQPPFAAYKRDLNLRNMLVHSNGHSSTGQYGSRAFQRPRCHTCQYISSDTEIRGPNYLIMGN